MQGIAFPAPVLLGQEESPTRLGDRISRHPELQDFVCRSGIGVLRVFQMSAPQGPW